MKILSIHWGLSFGGVSTYAATIERLKQNFPGRLRSLCLLPRGRVADRKTLASLDAIAIPIGSMFDPSWIRKLREAAAQESPDCILTHGFNAHFASLVAIPRGFQVNRIATYHGEYHPHTLGRRFIAPIYNSFTHYFMRFHVSSILSVSRAGAELLVRAGVRGEKITVINNGILDYVSIPENRVDIRRAWGIGEDEIIIGTASRLEAIKGLNYLIEAYAKLLKNIDNLRLVLIGDGPERVILENQVKVLGLGAHVLFTGMRDDVADCLSAIDIFVLPSLSEAHSIGMIEAMRAGKAIVATDVGGNTESVSDEQEALIVKSADAAELASALKRFSRDPELRATLGGAARKRYLEEFTESKMIERTAQWLLNSCKGWKRPKTV